MNNNIKIAIFFFIIFILSASIAEAQEKDKAVITQIKKFQDFFGTRDPLQEALGDADKLKEEFYNIQAGIDIEAAEVLRNLRDPFESQLPKFEKVDSTPVEMDPAIDNKDERTTYIKPRQFKAKPRKPNLEISGLVWNSDMPQAIVNGQVVTVGGIIQNWTILNITQEGIQLRFEDETILIEP